MMTVVAAQERMQPAYVGLPMIIKCIQIKRFRCIRDASVGCDSLTALVGRNGSGKSTVLRALELFYASGPKLDIRDFYGEDASEQIEIAITFAGLSAEEVSRFEKYIENSELRVVRVFSLSEGKLAHRYHGFRLLNPEFMAVRSAGGSKEAKANYETLRAGEKYGELPSWVSREQATTALSEWEAAHPGDCSRQIDEGQFFGFGEVAQGYLGKFTKFIPIPAVRDASSEAEEGKGSAITEIMDLVVRSALASHRDLQNLRDEARARYDEIIDPAKLGEMADLERALTETLVQYAPEGAVHLAWLSSGGIDIQLPKAEVKLTEDGYRAGVARTGHGLQRAFILTMLQYLAKVRAVPTTAESPTTAGAQESGTSRRQVPDLILAIEEPELYQHPSRQRHLSSILLQLATTQSTLGDPQQRTQVIYTTHSPAFVGLDRFNQIRLFRKRPGDEGRPKCSSVDGVTLDQVAIALWNVHGATGPKFTEATLRPRLRSLMTPWLNEGFFADVVVLVEGEEDRSAILGYAAVQGKSFDANGISVIPCMGKNNLDRAALIFDSLGIPVYVIWDSDEGAPNAAPNFNRCLLRIVGGVEEDFPHRVEDRYACFKKNLTTTVKEEIGEPVYEEVLFALKQEFALTGKEALKNPAIFQELIQRAKARSRSSEMLENIIERILGRKVGTS